MAYAHTKMKATRVGRLDGSARMVDSGASLAAMKNGAAVHEHAIGVGVLTAAKQVSEHGRAIRRADRAIAGDGIATYVISRRRIARSRFATGPGFAWSWVYDVVCGGVEVAGGSSGLQATKNYIARHAKQHDRKVFAVRMAWESEGGAA